MVTSSSNICKSIPHPLDSSTGGAESVTRKTKNLNGTERRKPWAGRRRIVLDLMKLSRFSFSSAHRKLGMSRGILVRKVVKKNSSEPSILLSSSVNARAVDDASEVHRNGAAVNTTSIIGEELERVALFPALQMMCGVVLVTPNQAWRSCLLGNDENHWKWFNCGTTRMLSKRCRGQKLQCLLLKEQL